MCELEIMKEPYPNVPICETCKHKIDRSRWMDKCYRGPYKRCLVSGLISYHECSTMREAEGPCGPEGRLYEPYVAPTFVERLIALFK